MSDLEALGLDTDVWEAVLAGSKTTYFCKYCSISIARHNHCKRHEERPEHTLAIQVTNNVTTFQNICTHIPSVSPTRFLGAEADIIENASTSLLDSFLGSTTDAGQAPSSQRPKPAFNWSLFEASGQTRLAHGNDGFMQTIRNVGELWTPDATDNGPSEPIPDYIPNNNDGPRKRARMTNDDWLQSDCQWFPWPDKVTCTLDILMHLPRSVFSRRQLDLFLWLLRVNNINDVPSVKSMMRLNCHLQQLCGIRTLEYEGALGHRYFVNSLGDIIAQELANPRVRKHLHFFPEDSGTHLEEARQGARWLHEIDNQLKTPMVRIGLQDYFIHEPVMLMDGSCCMPTGWFTRSGEMFATCWKMCVVPGETGVDEWVVVKDKSKYEIAAKDLAWCFTTLKGMYQQLHVPDPCSIRMMRDDSGVSDGRPPQYQPWTLTDPTMGNRWRTKANGHRVYSFPIWLYCDDISGNMSKKWNEHNSFLFIPAGLPRDQVSKEYNIHFLSTSNLAPPLEMLDGIVDQLQNGEENGIWAWDCQLQEIVLIIPFVLALLGDNPMQSEFACHMGLRANFFCRTCWVKGLPKGIKANLKASVETDTPQPSENTSDTEYDQTDDDIASNSNSEASDVSDIDGSVPQEQSGALKKAQETLADIKSRLKSFVKVGRLRNKQETTEKLNSFLTESTTVGSKTKVEKMRTQSGIKDTYQLHFLEKLFASYSKKKGRGDKTAALQAAVENLPARTTSSVLRIRGLDAHQDTPVEILHVVLLGFVKYFWRDVIQNQIGKAEEIKKLLITRLNSVDTSALPTDGPIAGRTLVQYAGSLTGRDFRAIAQVAPFVLHGLVSDSCYHAWVSLSKLIPLIWQPVIDDISVYLQKLEIAIENFLLCSAQWSSRWFFKPKFHILVHLPVHIRRFGPAILFATESFESFNAVIRAKSIHSNRQAPSRDIALAFAQGSRVRHLLSGGFFVDPSLLPETCYEDDLEDVAPKFERQLFKFASNWKTVGDGPLQLIQEEGTVSDYLGIKIRGDNKSLGSSLWISTPAHKRLPRPYNLTHMGQIYPGLFSSGPNAACLQTNPQPVPRFLTPDGLTLLDGDTCRLNSYAAIRKSSEDHNLMLESIVRIHEILQPLPGVNQPQHSNLILLVELVDVSRIHKTYGMPHIDHTSQWCICSVKEVVCKVDVKHDCVSNHCSDTGRKFARQERANTTNAIPIIHHINPENVILNTARMRDAVHILKYQPSEPAKDSEAVLIASAVAEFNAQKHSATSKKGNGRLQGGQGGSRGKRGGRLGVGRVAVEPRNSGLHRQITDIMR